MFFKWISKLTLIIVLLEIMVAIMVGYICAVRGGCSGDCIAIGYSVTNVCFWVGAKTLMAFIGADAVIWFLLSFKKKNSK